MKGFYVTGGTLRPDAASYVERRADRELLDGLVQGEFCYVLTSRQMGKSSLMVRTANALRAQQGQVVVLDLTAIGQNVTPEQWYDGMMVRMGRQLGLEEALEAFWRREGRLSPVQRMFAAIRDVVLASRSGPLVIFVDESDTVRSLPFSTDEFFAAIREAYNRRSEDSEMKRLTFCLLGVATPSDLIRETRLTPFNIGRRIDLQDFSETEALPLAKGLSGRAESAGRMLQRVLHWTGGHPYLTQRLCLSVAEDPAAKDPGDVDRHCRRLFLTAGARERDDNLIFVRERMLKSEVDASELLGLYGRVRRGRKVADDEAHPTVSVLKLSGITRGREGRLRIRNRIYGCAFDRKWISKNMPDAERRRQRVAFRRGMAGAVAGVAVLGLFLSLPLFRNPVDPQALAPPGYTNVLLAEAEAGLSNAGASAETRLAPAPFNVRIDPFSHAGTNSITEGGRTLIAGGRVNSLNLRTKPSSPVPTPGSHSEEAVGTPAATLLGYKGEVEIQRAGASAWDPAYTNITLHPGDALRTKSRSYAHLKFEDGGLVQIGELCYMRLPSAEDLRMRTALELLKGIFYFFHRKSPTNLFFETPTVKGVIKG